MLVFFKFVRIEGDIYAAMTSDVEHRADDSGRARTSQKGDPCRNLLGLLKLFIYSQMPLS
jgi:hypothetical protein